MDELTYAQVIGAVNRAVGPDDYALTAAGGLPGELNVNWLAKGIATPTASTASRAWATSLPAHGACGWRDVRAR